MGTVAAGALVVGTSLLVVFALATQALDYQLESSLKELENSNEPPPSMRFTKVQNIEEAVAEIIIADTDRGEDIVCAGTCQLRLGTGGTPPSVGDFTAEFTLCNACHTAANNEVDTVTITNHGSYLYTTTSTLTLFATVTSATTAPIFTFDVQTIVYANVKNVGVTNIDTSVAWVTVNGSDIAFQFEDLLNFEDGPTNQLTINSSDPFPIMYPGEVFTIQHLTGGSIAKERITFVSAGVIAASNI